MHGLSRDFLPRTTLGDFSQPWHGHMFLYNVHSPLKFLSTSPDSVSWGPMMLPNKDTLHSVHMKHSLGLYSYKLIEERLKSTWLPLLQLICHLLTSYISHIRYRFHSQYPLYFKLSRGETIFLWLEVKREEFLYLSQ